MKRNNHLKDLIEIIKRTDEMITLHKSIGDMSLIIDQYEAIKARQVSELVHELIAFSPYHHIESISAIKTILSKFYPELHFDTIKKKELRELEDALS